ncbi:NAD-dependent succinate-semialdehyde dehydrogenase [Parendozoicomonas sp. Alg238-R29]|uniref:NAD-dependent succinate-semialdehyde dehydrogenase n=1 Tax=Parendozoicomonas sp. Alg238-R29 TaxID=2993446 RepID=UPI00248F45F5|nr:NAD-dependent succinate-semialdehyde dehydrogenase [Parendozoicomonas sp. Alg238-R29]
MYDTSSLSGKYFINGKWSDAISKATLSVCNPATGETIGHVAHCGQEETHSAIEAASRALNDWRNKTAKERSALLLKLYDLMMENQESLARLMTAEQGKPLAESRGEIAYAASFLQWFAEEAKRIYGDVMPAPKSDQRIVVTREAIGVVACITPWNFPSAMLTRKIGPALAAGCTVVCKPANATPLSAYAIAELTQQAGIPDGVINIVTGNTAEIGAELTSNPKVRKVTFTGSTPVGKQLIKQCAETVKRTSMELGGNAPFIVFDDADLDAAIVGALASKYRNSGQTCVCANRIMIQDTVYDEFVERLTKSTKELQLGNGLDEGVTIGPLINESAARNVFSLIADAVAKGATIVTGGQPSALGGSFVEPTVLTGITPDMRIYREEIFGPVAPLIRFSTVDEAIAIANDTEFGLACYFYTRDIGRVWKVSEQLEYGIVGINEGIISTEVAPFGGMKESGNGREGSKYGIDDYVEMKYLCMGGIN